MRSVLTILLLTIAVKVSATEQAVVAKFELSHNLYESFCLIGIEGTITPQTATKFKERIEDQDTDCKVVAPVISVGSSIGGDVEAALKIAEIIKQKELNTLIWKKPMRSENSHKQQECLSACALIFASGRNRFFPDVYTNRILGIHKPAFLEQREDKVQAEMDLDRLKYHFIRLFESRNISSEFTINMFETRFEDMYYPDVRELSLWGVITSFEYPPSFTQPIRN